MKEKTIGGVTLKQWVLCFIFSLVVFVSIPSFAVKIMTVPPNSIQKFTAVNSLLGIIDSALFTVGARVLAAICILGAGWNLKEQRFAMAGICIFAAIMIATTPMWVNNIFAMKGTGGSIFGPPTSGG